MGGTRGRIYIKHADLFKVHTHTHTVSQSSAQLQKCVSDGAVELCQYAADAKDKQWLAERHHMRATGGKMVSQQHQEPHTAATGVASTLSPVVGTTKAQPGGL